MADRKTLAEKKAAQRRKKQFIVKESKFTAGVKKRWRFPRGMHSQVRQMHKGKPALPSPGFGSPKELRGLHRSGLFPVLVKNERDLLALDKEKQGIIIAKVGQKKKLSLLQKAKALSLEILNVKDADAYTKKVSEALAERKKGRSSKQKSKAQRTADAKKVEKEAEKKAKEDALRKAEDKSESKEAEVKAEEKKESPKKEEAKKE